MALLGGLYRLATRALRGDIDDRAGLYLKKELRGEFAAFELRLMERLDGEGGFLRRGHADDRFKSLERAIEAEAAERGRLVKRFESRAAGA